jgi:hypothetical protein
MQEFYMIGEDDDTQPSDIERRIDGIAWTFLGFESESASMKSATPD